jgi:hypothetical protein
MARRRNRSLTIFWRGPWIPQFSILQFDERDRSVIIVETGRSAVEADHEAGAGFGIMKEVFSGGI